jgi:hypothetical protein
MEDVSRLGCNAVLVGEYFATFRNTVMPSSLESSGFCHKHQIWVDIQSEHNYVILSGIIQRIDYMFRPLLGHHQVVLSLHSNGIT